MRRLRALDADSGRDVRYALGVAAITLLGAGLRFAAPAAKSVWLDEAFSVWMAGHSPVDQWAWLVQIDHHPPLYYLLLYVWQGWFGDGPGAIRALSALCSVLVIPLFAGIGRTMGGRSVGLTAALVLAVSPWQVRYAQEARMYGLLMLAVTGTLYAAVRLLAYCPPKEARLLWPLLVVSQAAAMLTHNTAVVLLPPALNLGVGGAWWMARTRPNAGGLPGAAAHGFGRRWGAAQAAAVALWALWATGFLHQARVVDARFWVQPPTSVQLEEYVRMLADGFLPAWHPPAWLAVALVLGLAGLGVAAWREAPGKRWFSLALLLTPPFVELVVSLRRPLFHVPSLIWTALPLYLLVATGWVAILSRRRRLALGTAAALLVLWALGLRGYFFDFQKERWDLAAAHVAAAAQPGDLVLFNASWVQLPFQYALREMTGDPEFDLELRGVPVDLFARGELEPVMTPHDVDTLTALVRGRDRVWLVYSHQWYTDPEGLIPAEMERHFAQVERWSLPDIQILRYTSLRPRAP